MTALALVVPLSGLASLLGLGVAPAAAAPGDPQLLQISKSVAPTRPAPGQTFTYTIQVSCSEAACINAQLTDTLPAELAGFEIQNAQFTPGTDVLKHQVTWSPSGATAQDPPDTVDASTSFTVAFQQVISQGPPQVLGLVDGATFTAQVSLKVPDDYPPGLSPEITNTAHATADNAAPVQDDATIRIDSPILIDVEVDKAWTPATQVFDPGAASTIALDARNSSNVAVDTLTLEEPKAPADPASALAAANPFTITDFTGFGTGTTLPAGCETVQLDAYVDSGGSWSWTQGTPVATPTALTLPAGVTNDEVGGIRVTCRGLMAPGATLGVDLDLALRATHRNDDADLSLDTWTVNNTATGSAALAGQPPATDDGSDNYTVTPLIPSVDASKNITPERITAGQSATASIGGTNGNVPVQELHIADLSFFTAEVTFGGFTGPLSWPASATTGTLVYHPLGETGHANDETVTVSQGVTPPAPTTAAPISGFEITWTGPIAASETGGAEFTINTTETATGGADELELTNTVTADVTAENGLTDDDSATDTLQIVNPDIEVTLDKTIRPSSAVEPGEFVISSLAATAVATGDGATVHEILIEDVWAEECDEFWNAFDLSSIAATQVPAGTRLLVEVRVGAGWVELTPVGPNTTATVYQLSAADLATQLGSPPTAADGIRFTFTNSVGFPADLTVTPNVVFTARGDLRLDTCAAPPIDEPVVYENAATVDIEGETKGGAQLEDDDEDSDDATVIYPQGGGGPGTGLDIDKEWDRASVASQADQQASTDLIWSVDAGFSPVRISDGAGDPATTPVQQTVFDAFDLVRINSIAASSEPYENGWWLKYDTVTAVELYDGSTWVTVPAPSDSWMDGSRGFEGYTLSTSERDSTIAVRITLQETAADTTARTNALTLPGAGFDPFAPVPGSGVGSGSSDRTFDLTWQLRNKSRVTPTQPTTPFVTADREYNVAGQLGLVDNSVELEGTPSAGGDPVDETANDTIVILDPTPVVTVAKSVTPTSNIYVPPAGSSYPDRYPTARWSITAKNGSVARASYVRVTDPASCTDTGLTACETPGTPAAAVANPFDINGNYLTNPSVPNPFERFTAERITVAASIAGEIDLSRTTVWLLRWSAGVYSTTQTTASAVNALTTAQLADVVGFSVTFQGADPATTGGTITQANNLTVTVDSRLRPTLRSSGQNQVLSATQTVNVTNRVFAQSYDPVTSPGATNGDAADATTQLTGGVINVAATKTVSPTQITKPQADDDQDTVTVTLGANQGANPRSTLSPARVVIEDQADSPEFWDAFDFVGFRAVTGPAGADRVQVDVYDGTEWVQGVPLALTVGTGGIGTATPTLPADVDAGDVQGVRFSFFRADGRLFSETLPAPNWTASAPFTANLRQAYRSGGDMEFPSVIRNTQTSQSTRPDGNDSPEADANGQVTLVPGTQRLAVNKLTNNGNRLGSVGSEIPFDLTFTNVGTGYLTLTELRDVLPPQLIYTGARPPTYTADATGTLSEDVTLEQTSVSLLTFTWPEGDATTPPGNVMQPGETFKIRLYLQLQPGLGTGQTATNTMTVQTEEPLASCTNTQPGGSTTNDWAQDSHTCGTSDYIGVVTGPNLFTVKGVRGSLDGAYQPGNPDADCLATLSALGGNYYRNPCVAHSTLGGTDDWVLHAVNAGTVTVDELTIFEQLPVAGDQLLVTGDSRGSQYRPQLVADSIRTDAPAGTTVTVEVTSSPNVCLGTWSALPAALPCEQQGEVWSVADDATTWSSVTGLRVRFDFRTTQQRTLASGQRADVTFQTVNVPRTPADPTGASTNVPAADQLAWNQFGVKYLNTGSQSFSKIAPSKVGVHLRVGSIQVVKEITGPAAQYAPDEFLVDVECAFGDVALSLGDDAILELNDDNGFTARIDGIPVGSECTVTEQGDVGEFGETSRTGTPTTLQVLEPTDPNVPLDEQDVPTAQIATITNDYRYTGLSVTKVVDTESTGAQFGPFQFSLTCTSLTGKSVVWDEQGGQRITFSLKPNQTWTAPADRIPVGATCTLRETDGSLADEIVFTGDNVIDNGDGSATVRPGSEPATVQVTNAYDAGTMTLTKVVDGAGAGIWGQGPFRFDVGCTYQGQTLFDDAVALVAGGSRTLGPYPAGTRCRVAESGSAGASGTKLDPPDGVVTIPKADQGQISRVTVTATNTFALTSLEVEKTIVGDLTADGAGGPFVVSLSCTWLVDGQRVAFAVPGGAERVLSTENGYRASYQSLPSSSVCELTELETGGADDTSIVATIAGVTTSVSGAVTTVDLTGTKGPGEAVVTITNEFEDSGLGDEGDDSGDDGGAGGLADTGAQVGGLALLAMLLIGVGVVVVRRGRREV